MKKVYICSRYKGSIKKNVELAIRYSQFAYRKGCLPICVHIFLQKVTGLTEQTNRKQLLKIGLEYVKMCDELWIFDRNGISEGMKQEIKLARKLNIQLKLFDVRGKK